MARRFITPAAVRRRGTRWNRHLVPSVEGEAAARQSPFLGNGEEHNNAVRRFFVEHGLPEDQIGTVTALGGTTLTASQGSNVGEVIERHYSSAVGRVIDGVSVPESVAVARLDGEGRPVAVTTFWPEIPKRAVVAAKTLAALMKNGRLTGKLGQAVRGGSTSQVVLHHTRSYVHEPVKAIVTVDVRDQGFTRSFDASGRTVNLRPESPAGPLTLPSIEAPATINSKSP